MSYLDYDPRGERAPIAAESCADERVSSGELWVTMWEIRRELARTDTGLARHQRLSQEANRLYFELVMRGDVQMPLVPDSADQQAAVVQFPVASNAQAA